MTELANHYDVIIVGAGASGLFCAAAAGQCGLRVLVIEHTSKVGKKILMSGGGRCNFTNLQIEADNYICANPHFCKSALNGYTQWDFIALVDSYGIKWHEREHGQLFCDNSAREILDMLLNECDKAGVTIETRCEVTQITAGEGYTLVTSKGSLTSDKLVIATGGLSIPTMNTTPFGYQVAEQFGMRILPTRAGLVPFMFSDWFREMSEKLSGIAIEVSISTGKHTFTENILFTHRGLSGPAVLQLSNYWKPGKPVSIDLLPRDDLEQFFLQEKQANPRSSLRQLLIQKLPKKLVDLLAQRYWMDETALSITEIPNRRLAEIAHVLHHWELKPASTEGYRTAEVTLGGVDTDDLSSKTMESKTQDGLYFIGEVVDVTGHLGGYNFQWAWSSAYAAAKDLC
jgi:predicted Rossmann fold flavoprotein